MDETLHALYQLRVLRGQCEAGVDVDFEAADRMAALEKLLPQRPVTLGAAVKSNGFKDAVVISQLGASSIECQACPWLELGDIIELVVDINRHSYRFKMLVTRCEDDAQGDFDATLSFVGVPVMLRLGPKSKSSAPSIQRVAA